ncbi:hypothetical protein BH10BDE1_BH10BDE1_35890 [soil metagenome]
MYEPLLFIHSWFRWLALLSTVYYFGACIVASIRRAEWGASDNHFHWAYNQLIGYQIGFGVALWLAASPFVKAGLSNINDMYADPVLFFWTVRHPLTMLAVYAIYHIGRAFAKKVNTGSKHKVFAVTFAVILILMASAIPWSWLDFGRPNFRWL